tara:strand:- start:211 stop:318 length:108 start_codon:yes stop_codon:yes gene_type:complete
VFIAQEDYLFTFCGFIGLVIGAGIFVVGIIVDSVI